MRPRIQHGGEVGRPADPHRRRLDARRCLSFEQPGPPEPRRRGRTLRAARQPAAQQALGDERGAGAFLGAVGSVQLVHQGLGEGEIPALHARPGAPQLLHQRLEGLRLGGAGALDLADAVPTDEACGPPGGFGSDPERRDARVLDGGVDVFSRTKLHLRRQVGAQRAEPQDGRADRPLHFWSPGRPTGEYRPPDSSAMRLRSSSAAGSCMSNPMVCTGTRLPRLFILATSPATSASKRPSVMK